MSFRSSTPGFNSATTSKPGGNEFTEGFTRIVKALNISTQLELADILNIRQSSISDAKRRGVIPGEWALKLYKQHKLNPRWVYDGLPPTFLSASEMNTGGATSDSSSFLLKYPEGSLAAVRMSDASMEPSIRRNAFVGIYLHDKEMSPGAFHGLNLPLEGITVRRIHLDRQTGMALVSADNPSIPQQRVPLERMHSIVLGRVIWIMSPV
ncbi:MAG: helix-turn-helix domain-containing protein [Desulfovibrio sp.]|jgi:hypothetical protein|nr:helix-turn-helix domain-containing protein [Desulfovibrio sp.]MBI4959513.1 helix-turn-helix domain-containing protein [Desulfovibrio sp.]